LAHKLAPFRQIVPDSFDPRLLHPSDFHRAAVSAAALWEKSALFLSTQFQTSNLYFSLILHHLPA